MNGGNYICLSLTFITGILLGSVCYGRVERLLLYLIELLYYRAWVVFGILAVSITLYFLTLYLEKAEKARTETELTEETRNQIRHEIENGLASKILHANKVTAAIQTQRKRLQVISSRLFQENDHLQKGQLSFIHFVEQVHNHLGRRSQKLLDSLPENPVSVAKIKERDERLQLDMRNVLTKWLPSSPILPIRSPPLDSYRQCRCSRQQKITWRFCS